MRGIVSIGISILKLTICIVDHVFTLVDEERCQLVSAN
jgi:hypothetical protein